MKSSASQQNELGTAVIDGAFGVAAGQQRLGGQGDRAAPDEKLHMALDANTNCIAVIMKHVAGTCCRGGPTS